MTMYLKIRHFYAISSSFDSSIIPFNLKWYFAFLGWREIMSFISDDREESCNDQVIYIIGVIDAGFGGAGR